MPLTKVLIQFMSPNTVENVISALALKPEILIPVGYGPFLSDSMRGRYNYFFHLRQCPTIVSEPVQLEQYLPGDTENRLEQMLTRYEQKNPVVDISGADRVFAMALGSVLRGHRSWNITVLDKQIQSSIFLPLRNGDYLKQLAFPKLTRAEFVYLRDGTLPKDYRPGEKRMVRADLTRSVVKEIRSLGVLYLEGPAYWRDVADRLRYAIAKEERLEYLLDTTLLGIRDTALEELRAVGILEEFGWQNGIAKIRFPDLTALRLLLSIDRILTANIFVAAAFVREYGRSAAYHDLTLHELSVVTGIHDCLPVVLMIFDEEADAEQLYRFHMRCLEFFDEPVRKILVRFGTTPLDDDMKKTAELLSVEIVPMKRLPEVLEPR